jgi:hypothetical protein
MEKKHGKTNSTEFVSKFGIDEYGFTMIPAKYSNVQISRYVHAKLNCTYCFPHGIDTINNHWHNQQRSWKTYRKTQYKGR